MFTYRHLNSRHSKGTLLYHPHCLYHKVLSHCLQKLLASGHTNTASIALINSQFEMHTDESQFALPKPHRPAFVQQLPSGHGFEGSHCLFCCRLPKKALIRGSLFEDVSSYVSLLLYEGHFFTAAASLLGLELLLSPLFSKTFLM